MRKNRWNSGVAAFALGVTCATGTVAADLPETRGVQQAAQSVEAVRGYYSSSVDEHARWEKLIGEYNLTASSRRRGISAALKAYGVTLGERETDGCFGDEKCEGIIRAGLLAKRVSSWVELQAGARAALPVCEAIASTSRSASHEGPIVYGLYSDLDSELKARLLHDQTLRASYSKRSELMPPAERMVLQLCVGLVISDLDHDNTRWLKSVVLRSGWPHYPGVTKEGQAASWILLVHARDDPVFRMVALERMDELVRNGIMSSANYATRVDHVLFETTGRQRYGTMGTCKNRAFVVDPVENSAGLDALRRRMGLPTVAEQSSLMASACNSTSE